MFKKMLCLLLALVLTVGVFPVTTYAEEDGSSVEETVVETTVLETEASVIETTEEVTVPVVVETDPVIVETTEAPVIETTEATVPVETQAPVVEPTEATIPVETEAPVVETTEATEATEPTDEDDFVCELYYVNGILDADDAFAGYVQSLFQESIAQGGKAAIDYAASIAYSHLSAEQKSLYSKLLPLFRKVAAGSRESSVFTCGKTIEAKVNGKTQKLYPEISLDLDSFGTSDFQSVLDALYVDHPYEMYWFLGQWTYKPYHNGSDYYYEIYLNIGAPYYTAIVETTTGFKFHVTADTSETAKATTSLNTAKSTVQKYETANDYAKLLGYYNTVANAVSNTANTTSDNYNPMMMVAVFDGDSSTTVNCWGAARAFQYLCDLTKFSSGTVSYLCMGDLGSGVCANHAWNVVKLGGKYYIVDVAYDRFLEGGKYSKSSTTGSTTRYYYTCGSYQYGFDQNNLYTNFNTTSLKLNTTGYKPVSSITIKKTNNQDVTGLILKRIPGKTFTLLAVCSPDNASSQSITWTSSNPSVVTVDSKGVITTKKVGSAVITAAAKDGVNESSKVTVKVYPAVTSVAVSKGNTVVTSKTISLIPGDSVSVTASCSPSNAIQSVTWSSSNTSIATVSSKGVVTAKKAGTATITVKAADGSGKSAKVTVKVYPATTSVAIKKGSTTYTNKTLNMRSYSTATMTATCAPSGAQQGVTWKSDDPNVAVVSSSGVITAKEPGTAIITVTATDGSGKSAKFTVVVRPEVTSVTIKKGSTTVTGKSLNMRLGKTLTLTAACNPTSPTSALQSVTWSSSDSSIASVSTSGVVTAKKAGTVTITAKAKDGSGKSAKVTIKAYPEVTSITVKKGDTTITNKTLSMKAGSTVTLSAKCSPSNSLQSVTWTSDNTSVATVSASGVVTAKKAGNAVITIAAKDGSGISSVVIIKVK